jgi:hypothetical protein
VPEDVDGKPGKHRLLVAGGGLLQDGRRREGSREGDLVERGLSTERAGELGNDCGETDSSRPSNPDRYDGFPTSSRSMRSPARSRPSHCAISCAAKKTGSSKPCPGSPRR